MQIRTKLMQKEVTIEAQKIAVRKTGRNLFISKFRFVAAAFCRRKRFTGWTNHRTQAILDKSILEVFINKIT